jgi:diacylglycerol kinase (ATP)
MWQVIINPTAGSGKAAKKWKVVAAKLKAAGIDFEAVFTSSKGHATILAKTAIENGCRKLLVLGGDGTNHEVMNGIMQQKVVETTAITQCLIPVGTGNDWIRTHQLPRNIDKIIKNIKANKTKLQDIGKVNFQMESGSGERYFMNVAGLAYDAFIAKKSNENPNLTKNKFSYLYLILRCLFQYKPQNIKIEFNGQTVQNQYYTVNVGICKYNGGGMRLVPQAIPDDGLFALTTVDDMSIPGVIAATPYLYNGKIGNHRKSYTTQTDFVTINSLDTEQIMLELDGEYVGVSPIRFEIIPNAFRFIA